MFDQWILNHVNHVGVLWLRFQGNKFWFVCASMWANLISWLRWIIFLLFLWSGGMGICRNQGCQLGLNKRMEESRESGCNCLYHVSTTPGGPRHLCVLGLRNRKKPLDLTQGRPSGPQPVIHSSVSGVKPLCFHVLPDLELQSWWGTRGAWLRAGGTTHPLLSFLKASLLSLFLLEHDLLLFDIPGHIKALRGFR